MKVINEEPDGKPAYRLLNHEGEAVGLDTTIWIGKNITDFEKEFGDRGPRGGSGVTLYSYVIYGKGYLLSVDRDGFILNIAQRDIPAWKVLGEGE